MSLLLALILLSGQRLAPSPAITCSRDHLTSFAGRVLAYQRRTDHIFLRVQTDEGTTESFTLRWQKGEDAAKWVLLRGEAFTSEDWKLVETAPSRLRPKMRAIVWVCDDGSRPVIDWRPAEK